MNINDFADAQRTHNKVIPPLIDEKLEPSECVPFVRLLDGEETIDIMTRRWELYHQLYSHFHTQVDGIVSNIETDLKTEISKILFDEDEISYSKKGTFRTLFLLGSDSTVPIEFKEEDPYTLNVIIDITPKESPNVRMMLRRSMFKLFSTADTISNKKSEEVNDNVFDDSQFAVSYDLSLVEHFKLLFGKNLNMVFNFSDVDSINSQNLDGFIVLLQSALKNEHVKISLVFNINTNLSIIEKGLKQSTLRFLKRNYAKLDVSSNKGFKYGNRIFQSFLDTVDNKLNLSEGFVRFILEKMANNTTHNLQLLTKILDYSLMSYFYQNPFAVFIDPVNLESLDESYLQLLSKCPTYMFFLDGLIKDGAPSEDISNLLNNKDSVMENFFAEFLVRDNPINRHAKFVANLMQEKGKVLNFNLIELYHSLLTDNLDKYVSKWSSCEPYRDELKFENVDTIFQELFTLDNSNDLLTQAVFPYYKNNLEDDLLCWEKTLPVNEADSLDDLKSLESLKVLNKALGPVVGHLFKLYREAPATVNIYDFYTAFRETLPEEEILNFLKEHSIADLDLQRFMRKNDGEDKVIFNKVALILFMQSLFDIENIGIVRAASTKNYDLLEKCIWRGI